MLSKPIQKQVEDIQGEWSKRLSELSIIALLLLIPIFVEGWFGSFIEGTLFSDQPILLLNFNVILLIVGLVFLLGIVWYFWRLRNEPQFHVLFIEHKEEERKQIDKKRFFMLFLIPVGVSIGLAFTLLSYDVMSSDYWWSLVYDTLGGHLYLNPNLYLNLISFYRYIVVECYMNLFHFITFSVSNSAGNSLYPLTVVVCSSILLCFGYLIKPERVQRSAPWLLFIPLIFSISTELYDIYNNVIMFELISPRPLPTDISFKIDISIFGYSVLFVTSLILLLYLTHLVNIGHREVSTLVKEKHLRGFIEKAVGILPTRVRLGDSHHICFDLTLSKDFVSADHLCIKNRCFKKDIYHQLENIRVPSNDYLEAEIQAVGIKVNGETRLRICETSPLSITGWNCIFPSSGTHTMNFMINDVRRDNSRRLIFAQNHIVRVENPLRGSWAPALALITPILTTVVEFLLRGGHT